MATAFETDDETSFYYDALMQISTAFYYIYIYYAIRRDDEMIDLFDADNLYSKLKRSL